MAYPYQMNVGNQQPNLAGGMNNQMPGQVPNMGVPNMGVPPAPMPYQPQPMFGMPQTYSPYPQQQSYGQTSYSPASSPTGQQPTFNNPHINWETVDPIRPPSFGTGGTGSSTQQAIDNFFQQMGYKNWQEIPDFRPFANMGNQQPIGGLGQTNAVPQFFTDYANQILTKQPANTPQYTNYSAGPMGLPVTIDQSLMGGATTGQATAAPANKTPMPTLTPQQIAKQNMMNLQQSLLEAGSRGPAGLQRFLDQLPKTGLTPQQIRAQQQAQMQLRNQQRLRNPSLSADPFTYTPRPAAPVMPAPTPQVNQVTRKMNPNGTFSVVR